MRAGRRALQRLESARGGQQAAQHDRARHADALALQVELLKAILAQRGERDLAEAGQLRVLKRRLGQALCALASNIVLADTALGQAEGHRAITCSVFVGLW